MTLPSLIPAIFRRKKRTFVVNEPEAVHNVIYLGNVLTILAKGDGCYDKPLALIWKTFCSKTRPDLPMVLSITRSGLQAQTKQQGVTEYWAHRITFCAAPAAYPKVFVWIYKHEGKRMKPELRCHAILCRKPEVPVAIAADLQERIQTALREYRREKLHQQNTRLSELTVGHPAIPKRKLLLTATTNFRPPMNRSRSAPKLGSIEEDSEEEEEVQADKDPRHIPSPLPPADMTARMFLVMEEDDMTEADCSPSPSSSDCSSSVGNSPILGGADAPRLDEGFSYSSSLMPGEQLAQHLAQLDIMADPNAPTLIHRRNSMTRRYSSPHPHSLKLQKEKIDPDSVSDESGYHEDKNSPEEPLEPSQFPDVPSLPAEPISEASRT